MAKKKDRIGAFLFQVFGPATVDNALQGHSREAREGYKAMRAEQRREARERRERDA